MRLTKILILSLAIAILFFIAYTAISQIKKGSVASGLITRNGILIITSADCPAGEIDMCLPGERTTLVDELKKSISLSGNIPRDKTNSLLEVTGRLEPANDSSEATFIVNKYRVLAPPFSDYRDYLEKYTTTNFSCISEEEKKTNHFKWTQEISWGLKNNKYYWNVSRTNSESTATPKERFEVYVDSKSKRVIEELALPNKSAICPT